MYYTVGARMHLMPPATAAQALLLPGSRQWPAERGSYSVFTLCESDNDFQGPDARVRLYVAGYDFGKNNQGCLGTTRGSAASQTVVQGYYAPYNTSGVYLSGLSYQTTLQLNVKWLVEVAPGPLDSLATLASESPEYDPAALELYSRVVSKLPPGVPQDENPSGEFYQNVLGTLGDVLQLGAAIHPAFGLLGGGVKTVGKMIPTAQRVVQRIV